MEERCTKEIAQHQIKGGMNLIIVEIIGGLGNQMFQYAAAQAVAISRGVELKLDVSSFQNYKYHHGFELKRVFNVAGEIANPAEIRSILGWQNNRYARYLTSKSFFSILRSRRKVVEPSFSYWPKIELVPDNSYLTGYWQSEKYFKRIASKIRNEFTFRQQILGGNLELFNLISEVNSVSLHIRRGDYVTNQNAASIHGVCSIEYYLQAVEYIVNHIENPYFFIFSDDIEWAQSSLSINYPHKFVNENYGVESYNDMRLMSLCKHNIIANSSFSWWGGWLNNNKEKIVIAPKKWFAIEINIDDLIPNDWIKMPPNK